MVGSATSHPVQAPPEVFANEWCQIRVSIDAPPLAWIRLCALCGFGLDLASVAISSVHKGFWKSMHMILKRTRKTILKGMFYDFVVAGQW